MLDDVAEAGDRPLQRREPGGVLAGPAGAGAQEIELHLRRAKERARAVMVAQDLAHVLASVLRVLGFDRKSTKGPPPGPRCDQRQNVRRDELKPHDLHIVRSGDEPPGVEPFVERHQPRQRRGVQNERQRDRAPVKAQGAAEHLYGKKGDVRHSQKAGVGAACP